MELLRRDLHASREGSEATGRSVMAQIPAKQAANTNGDGIERRSNSGRRLSRTAWKPGRSGNPNGRPKKGATLADLLDQRLDKIAFVDAVIALALEGNSRCIQEIFLRIDGPITQPVAQETVLRVEYADDVGEANDSSSVL